MTLHSPCGLPSWPQAENASLHIPQENTLPQLALKFFFSDDKWKTEQRCATLITQKTNFICKVCICLLMAVVQQFPSYLFSQVVSSLTFVFFLINLFIYFIFGCLRSSLLPVGFLQLRRAGATLLAVRGLFIAVASLVAEHGL